MFNDNLLEVDELSLYFGTPYVVNKYITISLPKIGELVEYGEKQYYNMVQTLTAIPSEMKSHLWDQGIDWTKITDFQLFTMLAPAFSQKQTSIILGDFDFQALRIFENPQNGEIVLRNPNTGEVVDELAYSKMQSYLCSAHNLTKKVETAANEYTKRFLIDEDRQNNQYKQKQPYKSFLRPLVSAVKCRMGYTLDYVKNMGLYEFMDDLARLQIITHSDALLHGSYSGMIDAKKIPKKELDWCREVAK